MNAHAPTLLTRRASFAPSTWNAEARTFEVVFATERAVARRDARGPFLEVLSMAGMQTRGETLPVLDSHQRGSIDAQLGTATAINVRGAEAFATVLLGTGPRADRLATDLPAGHRFAVSCGYTIDAGDWSTKAGARVFTATNWTLLEISIVSVPADPSSGIRSQNMENEPGISAPPAGDRAAINAEIRSIAKLAGCEQTWIDSQIDRGATVDEARAAAFEAMRSRSEAAGGIRNHMISVGTDFQDPEFRAQAMGEALFTRIQPSHTPAAPARQFIGMSIAELARDCLRTRGVSTMGLSPSSIVERALHSTSDFPLILADTVGRTMRQAYQAADVGIKHVAKATTARDFRAKYRPQIGAALDLQPVNEAGEFTSGTLIEAEESYKLGTFGRIFGITRQALVNDDLGAFADPSRHFGRAAMNFEAKFLTDLLASNPVMNDTVALFHADHGNLATGAASVDEISLTQVRQAMRSQTGLGGELISVTPRYLLVGPGRETEAEKALSTINPNVAANVNPFQGKLQLIVDPRLGGEWYVVADPAEIDGLEYAHLEGEPGPQLSSQVGFKVDGVEFKVRLDFGAGFVDWRGWYKVPGV